LAAGKALTTEQAKKCSRPLKTGENREIAGILRNQEQEGANRRGVTDHAKGRKNSRKKHIAIRSRQEYR
jgi:hypothetical protein